MSYNSEGGTGTKSVLAMQKSMKEELRRKRDVLEADKKRVSIARDNCLAMAAAAKNVKTLADLRSLVKKHTPGKQ